ncbi:MAG: DUF58 domain-containing protein [Byssovorax sp.]
MPGRLPLARAKALLTRLGPVLRRAIDAFPLTPAGLIVLGGAGVSLGYYGLGRIDLLLLVVGVVGLGLGAVSLLLVLFATLIVRIRLRKAVSGDPLQLESGVPARTGFTIGRLRGVPLVKLEWSWVEPLATVRPKTQGGLFHEQIVPIRRGFGERIVRRVVVSDAFGLCRVAFRSTQTRTVRVVPGTGALRHVHVVRSIASGEDTYDPAGSPEGERVDTRAYAPGDPMRFVLWKVYARSRQLVVRTPERAFSVARETLAYLVTGEGDEAAAGAARVAVEAGALGPTWVLGADGDARDATTVPQALELLARSAAATADEHGAGLGPFLKRNVRGAAGRAVVFVPSRPGPWIGRLVAAVRARPQISAASAAHRAPVDIVVCSDGIDWGAAPTILARFAFRRPKAPPSSARATAADLTAVLAGLAPAHARVLILDRVTGRTHTESQRKARTAAPAAARKELPRATADARSSWGGIAALGAVATVASVASEAPGAVNERPDR